jgi:hypothetical protein
LPILALILFWSKFQFWQWLRDIENGLRKIETMRNEAVRISVKTVKEVGKPKQDPTPFVNRFIEYTFIEPTSLDPAGIVWKLDHLLDVRDFRFKNEVKQMAPKATDAQLNNLENLLEASLDLNMLYKLVKHFYLFGKKTKSHIIVMQIHMLMPLIMQIAEAYSGAVQAFSNGYPIGDGAGALVAAKLMRRKVKKIAKDMVMSERSIDGKKVFVLKSEGPGGNVGKPGEAIKAIIERCKGKVDLIIMVDAQLKFEGEKTGAVTEGIGAAIGGVGTEKYKIEELSLKYKIPLSAVLIKESIQEAISPIKREIVEGVEEAVKTATRLIKNSVKKGGTVIVAGIGNSIGIGQ